MRLEALLGQLVCFVVRPAGSGHAPAGRSRKLGDFKAAVAQAEDEKTSCHLVRIAATRFFSRMLFSRLASCLALFVAAPCAAQGLGTLEESPDHLRKYNECMNLARAEPLKALPPAQKWHAQAGGLAA